MPRKYYKRYHNKDKYSVEQTIYESPTVDNWTAITNGLQWSIQVVPPVETEGMRKVKHLTMTFANYRTGSDQDAYPIFYALVYCPQGYDPNNLNLPTLNTAFNLYEPNQFVLSSGVLDFSGGPLRIRTPLARNLNSGDKIVMCLGTTNTSNQRIYGEVKYAITLQ